MGVDTSSSEPTAGALSAAAHEPATRTQKVGLEPGETERPLKDLLGLRLIPTAPGTVTWMLGIMPASESEDLLVAARILARRHMEARCGKSPAFELWLARAISGEHHPSAADRQRIEPFIRDSFGLPNDRLPTSQVQGYVAQLAWHEIMTELGSSLNGEYPLTHIEKLGFSVLEPGGDGLVVYQQQDSQLAFRLWEIKKHVGARPASTAIAAACDQIAGRGLSYLAKLVGIGLGYTGELGLLYAQLVDLWVESSPRAGLGIAVSTSEAQRPKRSAFGGVPRRFPQFPSIGQREGLFIAIGDFEVFSDMVQKVLWSGL